MEIRQAELPDFESVHDLICELALYEKAPAEVITDPEILAQHCLANNPFVFCWVCVHDHQILGTAICYIRYSTWKGPVLYLEDIVVKESSRRKGVGTALLNHLIAFAKKRKFERIIILYCHQNIFHTLH
jgi:GNAT superfamily N-acetyltransferase